MTAQAAHAATRAELPGLSRRDLALGAAAAVALSTAGPIAAAGRERDPLWFVNPQLRAAARQIQQQPFPAFSDATLPMARQGMARFAQPPRPEIPWAKRVVPGPSGAPDVTIYVINAKPGARRPGILHTHGGGFILGSAALNVRELQDTAAALDCAVVSAEYRLAPETRWSGSAEDNYAALRWLHGHAAELGVDTARLAVMGESAGGGHAALLAIKARDRGEVPLAFQCLVYPMLDDRTGSARAVPPPIGSIAWSAEGNRYGWRSFLGREPGGPDVPAAAVPARTASLAGLPPAWIGVGSIDLFVGEDLDYARRLIEAGVMTELLVAPGAFHGFDGIAAGTPLAQGFAAAKLAALRRALTA